MSSTRRGIKMRQTPGGGGGAEDGRESRRKGHHKACHGSVRSPTRAACSCWWTVALLIAVMTMASADFSSRSKQDERVQEETASAELEDYIHGLEEDRSNANASVYRRSRSLHPPASDEKRLTKYLLSNYRKIGRGGRPVSNSSSAVLVKFGLAMIQMGLDEKDNMLTTSVWCRYRWHDEYLTWEPSDFGGVHTIRLSSTKIWIPDIMLYNTADTHKMERDVLVVIEHTGEVLWIPHRIYRASCGIDVTNYPFDTQTCDMTFGSWAYHGNEIDLGFYEDMEMLDISDLERESTEWDIIAKGENRKSSYYDCCKDPYVTLTFTLSMRRKLVFSSFILTLPCIFLACMTLVVFWLPPERPDRTSLAMSLFASFLLLLLILVEAAPPTASSVPTLGLYYCFNMTLIMLSIFLSSVVININRKGESMKTVPTWLKALTGNCLLNLICGRCPRSQARVSKVKDHHHHSHHHHHHHPHQGSRHKSRSLRDTHHPVAMDAEDGVITNQEALQNTTGSNAGSANNSKGGVGTPWHHHQVEATLTSSNGVQTNVVPASQPLLSSHNRDSCNNSGDEGSGTVGGHSAAGAPERKCSSGPGAGLHDLTMQQVTPCGGGDREEEQDADVGSRQMQNVANNKSTNASHQTHQHKTATSAMTATELDDLSSNSSAAALLTENETSGSVNSPAVAGLPPQNGRLPPEMARDKATAAAESGCMSVAANNNNTCANTGGNSSSNGGEQLKIDTAMYGLLFRSLNTRLATLERHLANTERGIREVTRVLMEKDISGEQKELEREWKFIAFALDRMFFVVFIVAIGVSLGTLFPRPYQLQFI